MAGWRLHAAAVLGACANVWDPTRFPVDAAPAGSFGGTAAAQSDRLAHGRGTLERDLVAVRSADLLLANLTQVGAPSIGSIGEIFWAHAFGVPIVLVRTQGTIYSHAMLEAMAEAIFSELDVALAYARTRLLR
jgi:hypothetical protein